MRAIEQEAELQLGPVLLECRHRTRSAVWLDLGGSWVQLLLTPLVVALFVGIGAMYVGRYFELPRDYVVPASLFVLVATAIVIYSIYFSASDSISLALHERGFRYKNRLMPFTELRRIRTGKADTALGEAFQGLVRTVGMFHRGARMAANVKRISDQVTLTVKFKGGRSMLMKNALFEYREDDLQKFFDFFRAEHPELLQSDEYADLLDSVDEDYDVLESGEKHDEPAPVPVPVGREVEPRSITQADLIARTRDGIDPTYGDSDARDARNELGRNNYRSASYVLGLAKDPRRREFYVRSLQEWTGRPFVFEQWKRAEPNNPNAWLVSGAHLINWAWEARGDGRADSVDSQAWSTFNERLRLAASDLDHATVLDMEDPIPHALRLSICLGLNAPLDEARGVFDQALLRQPDHYWAHTNMLFYLCKKWHGSHDEMFGFARAASKQAPEGSLLPSLVAIAHTERWLYAIGFDKDPNGDNYFLQQEVRDEIIAAYARSLGSPEHASSPLSLVAANFFAYTLGRCGDWDSACDECARIGQYPSLFPWGYEGDPTDVYQRYRAALLESPAMKS